MLKLLKRLVLPRTGRLSVEPLIHRPDGMFVVQVRVHHVLGPDSVYYAFEASHDEQEAVALREYFESMCRDANRAKA